MKKFLKKLSNPFVYLFGLLLKPFVYLFDKIVFYFTKRKFEKQMNGQIGEMKRLMGLPVPEKKPNFITKLKAKIKAMWFLYKHRKLVKRLKGDNKKGKQVKNVNYRAIMSEAEKEAVRKAYNEINKDFYKKDEPESHDDVVMSTLTNDRFEDFEKSDYFTGDEIEDTVKLIKDKKKLNKLISEENYKASKKLDKKAAATKIKKTPTEMSISTDGGTNKLKEILLKTKEG